MRPLAENVYHAPLQVLLERIGELHGVIYHIDVILNSEKVKIKQEFDRTGFSGYLGTNLTIIDRTSDSEFIYDRLINTEAGYFVSIENYEQQIDNLLIRECGYSVAQAYEALTSYLKKLTATVLTLNPGLIPTLKRRELAELAGGLAYEDWIERFKTLRLKDEEFFVFLFKNEKFLNNMLKLRDVYTCADYYYSLQEFRHSFTHSMGVFKNQHKLTNWQKFRQQCIKEYFPFKSDGGVCTFEMSRERCLHNLRTIAEIAFQIYKWYSISNDFEWSLKRYIPEAE